ncbi:MAG: DUF5320 domain-containing protein [Candidatus Diapherotrites archaeon]|nr:DUF5320 domain-containing protein [Candidatus Diapherotrites archaeon]
MPFGFGRGFRWMYYATGMPGWMRYSGGYGNYWRCWRFPWLPRGWWTGIYGPVQWTPQGPQIVSDNQSMQAQLEEQAKAIEQEIANLQNELAEIRKRIEELNKGEK